MKGKMVLLDVGIIEDLIAILKTIENSESVIRSLEATITKHSLDGDLVELYNFIESSAECEFSESDGLLYYHVSLLPDISAKTKMSFKEYLEFVKDTESNTWH